MEKEIGVAEISAGKNGGKQGSSRNNGEYRGRCSVHMDAFAWVSVMIDCFCIFFHRFTHAVVLCKVQID